MEVRVIDQAQRHTSGILASRTLVQAIRSPTRQDPVPKTNGKSETQHSLEESVCYQGKYEHYANKKGVVYRTDNRKMLMNNREYEMFQ